MRDFYRIRSTSLAMVVLVLLAILLLQSEISYNTAYGALTGAIPALDRSELPAGGLVLRVLVGLLLIALWLLKAKGPLFKVIIVVNVLLTFGLFLNLVSLIAVLFDLTPKIVRELLIDVVLMAVSNILIFSIWYWIIDPPGVEEDPRDNEPWEFLFPQRSGNLPHYELWMPRYSDYLFLAFTTSFAFSPTDTLPLTRRAKMAMLLQSTVSLVTLTGIAGSAINMLAGGG
ncbi:MAG: hypothetical protein KDI03_13535 [Anaerolineae bacterium]|nr:hypothetical protein [Anaerolineae bacterium]MCB0201086.1 hypothetical protein [Anaerolineae bacterium]MCB0254898.1 hypothetical protein [Anaerolineae bacterium]